MADVLDIDQVEGCGARVRGLDVRKASDAQIDAIREAVFHRGVVAFDDQVLTPDDQIAFARRIAPIVVNRYFPKTERWPEIAKVEKTEDQKANIGGGWHTDHSYDAAPAMGSVLLAIHTPPTGGDTLFADMYEALPDATKARIAGLEAPHASAHVFGEGGAYAGTDQANLSGHPDTPEAVHPVVVTHPGSGRKALFVNPAFTREVVGLPAEEGAALLTELYAHAIQPRFVARYAWRPGTMAVWDNRCTWHFAMNDYHGHYRLMHRITLDGGPLDA
ncbi:TauD/TfdA family dioxygenase [Phenylobacterium sp. SCN 70-31]|uniref:TauD/TfdA dioxygenase family protein n=1 Tax=Phenylobacterium sp. SCN 70-31 TaxID=1660129 RepID=UPI00086F0CA8|nr:TauD/TfdA family dioxygenase [Phenylobacterium sp. SCN 70-31]ODT86947.1 MAG: taurine dioxygenase [Phenylobacterium sp. SCN 70-31]